MAFNLQDILNLRLSSVAKPSTHGKSQFKGDR